MKYIIDLEPIKGTTRWKAKGIEDLVIEEKDIAHLKPVPQHGYWSRIYEPSQVDPYGRPGWYYECSVCGFHDYTGDTERCKKCHSIMDWETLYMYPDLYPEMYPWYKGSVATKSEQKDAARYVKDRRKRYSPDHGPGEE